MSDQRDHTAPAQIQTTLHGLIEGLGTLSVIFGATELIWGGALSTLFGLAGYHWLFRVFGGGQILTGILILNSKDRRPWICLRVMSDVLHLGTLSYGYTREEDDATKFIIAFIAMLGLMAVDLYCAVKLTRERKVSLAQ